MSKCTFHENAFFLDKSHVFSTADPILGQMQVLLYYNIIWYNSWLTSIAIGVVKLHDRNVNEELWFFEDLFYVNTKMSTQVEYTNF
jgi:hypothetical protein